MRERKLGSVFIVVALLLAVAAGILSMRFVRSFNETTNVLVAVGDLPPFRRITKDDVRMAEVPTISVPKDAARNIKEIENLYTKETIYAGEPIRRVRLAQGTGKEALLSAKLSAVGNPDIRAFALPFDVESAVGGKIVPGDRVDIIASVKMEGSKGTIGVGKIIGRNVEVLDVFQNQGGTGGRAVMIVVLTPKEIEDIAFALTSGSLRFALNPYNTNQDAANTPGVTGEDWLTRYGFGSPTR